MNPSVETKCNGTLAGRRPQNAATSHLIDLASYGWIVELKKLRWLPKGDNILGVSCRSGSLDADL
jgi:hypothetical protein